MIVTHFLTEVYHFLLMMLYYLVNGANIILAFWYVFSFLLGQSDIELNP